MTCFGEDSINNNQVGIRLQKHNRRMDEGKREAET